VHGTNTPDSSNLDIALAFAKAGLPVFPAKVTFNEKKQKWDKAPCIKGWQQEASTDEQRIRGWWRALSDAVPGLELGRAGLTVIDTDRHGGEDGVAAFASLVNEHVPLPAHPIAQTAGGGEHHFFRQWDGEAFGNTEGLLRGKGINVRGSGGWVVAPGSVRPDGKRWSPAGLSKAYQDKTIPVLPDWIAAKIRATHKPKAETQSSTNDRPTWSAAEEARVRAALAHIPSEDRTTWFEIGAALHWTGWPCARAIWNAWSRTTPGAYDEEDQEKTWCSFDRPFNGNPKTLASLFHLAQANGYDTSDQHLQPDHRRADNGALKSNDNLKAGIHSWEEPDLSLLDNRRGELPDFPLEFFCSQKLQDLVGLSAHGSGTSVAHVGVPLLGIASSLIGTARRVQASRSWSQPMTCWASLVGYSGDGKTPGINETKRALTLLESNRKHKIASLERAHDGKVEAARVVREKWKSDLKAAVENGGTQPIKPAGADDPGKFVAPRLYVSDATIERIAVLLQARPQGMLLLADELAGLFLNMHRYTTGQDNEFWLECWNGDPYVVERMGRPSISLPHLLVGLVGGFQPDKLATSFKGDHDGMYARMLFAWPDKAPYRPLTDTISEVEPEMVNALNRLSSLGGDQELVIRKTPLTAEAREAFEQLRKNVDAGGNALDGRERDWWVKLPNHVLRLTGTLCYLDWAMTSAPEPTAIDVKFMQAAVHLAHDYFWPHARASLRQIGLTENHVTARRVLRWIATTGMVEVSREDIRRDALAQTIDADATQALLERLERAGWLRQSTSKPLGAGRPTVRWAVNPQLMR
jgi:Protein of unknown function (DUF3987)/Bifunctional DNA primase/polymerase, N-terminal/Primase C terminal 2 (PriCT-2)